MALENDFLVFAGASGANVLTQAAYASSTTLAGGYVTGTASSAAVNKTLRQTSIMSAMIAQFICDNAAQPAIDDGTTATLETNFEAAILAIADTVNIPISQVEGLASALAGFLPLTGNAVSASKLATARNIALTGAVTGAVNFDGSSNVSIATAFGNIAASSLLGNPTGSAAIAEAITLANGLIFSGTTLSLGAITPTSVVSSGAVSGTTVTATGTVSSGQNFSSTSTTVLLATSAAGNVHLRPNGAGSGTGEAVLSQAGVLTLSPTGNISTGGTLVAGLIVTGTLGGGITLVDGSFNWCFYDSSGTLQIGSATSGGGPTARMTLTTGGALTAGTGNFTASDERLKKNVVPVEPKCFHRSERAMAMFDWQDETLGSGRGPIAQDIQAQENLYVNVFDNKGHLSVDYGKVGYEQGIWCGRKIDTHEIQLADLYERVGRLEHA